MGMEEKIKRMILINYNGNANKTGIYCIRNQTNEKIYIGSTKTSFKLRKYKHLRLLRKNVHYNEHLQNAWNYYKEENFSFEILFICLPEECEKYEGEFIKLYSSNKREYGYNIASVSSYRFGYNMSNNHNNEKSVRKKEKVIKLNGLTTNERGIPKPFKFYDLNGNFIKEYKSAKEYSEKYNVEVRGMLSTILKKRTLLYKKQIILFSNDNLTIKDIENVKMRLTKRKVDIYDLTNNFIKPFDSVIECANFLNVKPCEVRMCCSGKRSRIREYITKY